MTLTLVPRAEAKEGQKETFRPFTGSAQHTHAYFGPLDAYMFLDVGHMKTYVFELRRTLRVLKETAHGSAILYK